MVGQNMAGGNSGAEVRTGHRCYVVVLYPDSNVTECNWGETHVTNPEAKIKPKHTATSRVKCNNQKNIFFSLPEGRK